MILVTGGTGLLGGHLAFKLLENGKPLRLLIRSDESKQKLHKIFSYYSHSPDNLISGIEWVYGDILDKTALEDAFSKVEKVYHCAAFVSFYSKDKKAMLDINIRGTANIVNACLDNGVKKLVHVSSIAAIKNSTEGYYTTENDKWPTSNKINYQYTKTQAEYEVWRGINEGLSAVIVNPSIIIGPGDWNSGSSGFFPRIFKGLKYYTKGVTGFVDVLDVVDAMIALMDSEVENERFIVSADNLSFELLFNSIADSMGVKRPDKYISRILTEIIWKLDFLRSKIFFTTPFITKETARAAHNIQNYSSEKLKQTIDFTYRPLDISIERIARQFLIDNSNTNS